MMHRAGTVATVGSALALALSAAPSLAQSVNDYRLPGTTTTAPNPRAQGPVDAEAPVVRTSPQPTATPSASPTAAPPPVTVPVPTATPPRAVATPSPQPSRAAQQPGRAGAAPAPQASAANPTDTTALPPLVAPGAAPSPGFGNALPAPMPTTAAPAAAEDDRGAGIWPWIAGLFALVAAGFALMWWRRGREEREPQITFEPPVVRAQPAPPVPEPAPEQAAPAPTPPPPAAPVPLPVDATGLEITLQANRMSASLMATTLNYKLIVTNRGAQALSGLAVEGDMVSAHSSLPTEQQVANDTHVLEPRHALVTLAPGESAEFTGDFRLPLTAVTPIRSGQAAFFVPLARLRVRAETPGGDPLVSVQTFVVGELPENPGAALRPFRLDLGPRTYSKVGQRAVN